MKRAYLAYLESPEWTRQRQDALRRANYQCEQCGGPGPFEIHHRAYTSVGDEPLGDLEVLCAPCHHIAHEIRNRRLRRREQAGQQRLFGRWDGPPVKRGNVA